MDLCAALYYNFIVEVRLDACGSGRLRQYFCLMAEYETGGIIMTGIVDRIEGTLAVIEREDGVFVSEPVASYGTPIKEGYKVDLERHKVLVSDFNKDDLSRINQYFND